MDRTSIPTDRLFAAADALLEALASGEGRNALIRMYVGRRLRDATDGAFTETELVEAMAMLLRMGFIGPPHRPSKVDKA